MRLDKRSRHCKSWDIVYTHVPRRTASEVLAFGFWSEENIIRAWLECWFSDSAPRVISELLGHGFLVIPRIWAGPFSSVINSIYSLSNQRAIWILEVLKWILVVLERSTTGPINVRHLPTRLKSCLSGVNSLPFDWPWPGWPNLELDNISIFLNLLPYKTIKWQNKGKTMLATLWDLARLPSTYPSRVDVPNRWCNLVNSLQSRLTNNEHTRCNVSTQGLWRRSCVTTQSLGQLQH